MNCTTEDIVEIAENHHTNTQDCRDVSEIVVSEAENEGCEVDIECGTFVPEIPAPVEGMIAPHCWVRHDETIIDPTIRQFEDREDRTNGVRIDRDLPSVGLYTEDDEEFDWYHPD